MVDRLPETVVKWVQKVVRDCRASLSKRILQTRLPAYGLWVKCSNRTGFLVRSSSWAEQSDSPDAHFLSSAFSGFAPGQLAGASPSGTISCVLQMVSDWVRGHRSSHLVDMTPALTPHLSVCAQKRSASEPAD